jgi:hypothetical protein
MNILANKGRVIKGCGQRMIIGNEKISVILFLPSSPKRYNAPNADGQWDACRLKRL